MASAAVKKNRPKYLNLRALVFEIRLPVTGWVSILHRVSGAMLFFAAAWMLWLLDRSLESEQGFEQVKRYVALWPVKLSLLVLVWAFCHHLCAGIRFLLIDLDKAVERTSARRTSWAVFGASLALTAWLGWKLW